ncbi:hypothetical protein RB195_001707 [Necator americanus]|uniref:SXP/RAL-2 family protein Ani s 5-like cation-binding domain-containing protein n=1 Tax=Necator americanus TaxID=51031 RepID=A0ABR1DH19_NECAM
MTSATYKLLRFVCLISLIQGIMMKRGIPAVSSGAGPFGVIAGLEPFYPPQYLRDVTDEAKSEYFDLLRNTSRTIAQYREEMLHWARKYLLEDRLAEFLKNEERAKENLKENMYELLTELPGVYEEFNAIVDNEEQTRLERRQSLTGLRKGYSEAFVVLKFAVNLISTAGYRRRKTNIPPETDLQRREQGKLVQKRLKAKDYRVFLLNALILHLENIRPSATNTPSMPE